MKKMAVQGCLHAICGRFSLTQSKVTRLIYVLSLVIAGVFSFILISPKGRILLGEDHCTKENYKVCESFFGYAAVYRLCSGFALYHLLFGSLTCGVRTSEDKRAAIQNQFWFVKLPVLVAIITGSLFIPRKEYTGEVWFFFGISGAVGFIILQYAFIAQLADDCAKWLDEKGTMSRAWKLISRGITLTIYFLCAISHVCLYAFYTTGANCMDNKFFITFHIYLCVGASIISRHSKVREVRPRSGLFQTSLIIAFSTYTLWLVQSNEPDQSCNPHQRYRNSLKPHYTIVNVQKVASFVLATVLLLWMALKDNDAPQYGKVHKKGAAATDKKPLLGLPSEGPGSESPLIVTDESRNNQLVTLPPEEKESAEETNLDETIPPLDLKTETEYSKDSCDSEKDVQKEKQEAETDPDKEVAEVSPHTLLTPCADENMQSQDSHVVEVEKEEPSSRKGCCYDDEVEGVEYGYTFLHAVFIMYIFFVMMTVTNWYHAQEHQVTIKLTNSWGPVWIRLSTLILCDLFYMYKLIVPLVMPESYDKMLFYRYFFRT